MIVIDGLEATVFDRAAFERLRTGGISCVTCTLAYWEGAVETMDTIARWHDLERENSDLIRICTTAKEIRDAVAKDLTGVVLGCQNTSPLEGRIRYLELFAQMGVRVMQLTYNNQNAVGGSCYEPVDSGLARFGRHLVREMNEVGVLIDLSHVGERTSLDVIELSEAPVAITHSNPRSLYDHPRNKSDLVLHALAERGGVIGLATYTNITGPWAESLEKWCEMVDRTIEKVGIEHVGIGTDAGDGVGEAELDWMRRGRWTREREYGAGSPDRPGAVPPPPWLPSVSEFSAIADGLAQRGLSEDDVAAVMGGNWMRLYEHVFDRETPQVAVTPAKSLKRESHTRRGSSVVAPSGLQ